MNNVLKKLIKFISQWRVIIPGFIILAVVILLPSKNRIASSQESTNPTPQQYITPVAPLNNSSIKGIDFNGAYSCDSASISARLKNKKLYISVTDKNKLHIYVLVGDCMYVWDKGTFSGYKYCALGQYISIAEALSKSGAVSTNNLLSTVLGFAGLQIKDQEMKAEELINSCKQTTAINDDLFKIPGNVLFKNKSLK